VYRPVSGEPTVGRANGRPRDPRETRGRANGREGAPDCPVCTGLCPVRQAGSGELAALGKKLTAYDYNSPDCPVCTGQCPVSQWSAARSARDTWPSQWSGGGTGLSGVDRIVSGAPMAPRRQRSASPNKEGDPHRTVSGGAPDCPVRQMTEGKINLPGMFSTAPSYLGAIKGTPRRMEEHIKHTQSIPKHQDFDSTHLLLRDSI
jgi:hypothetical protein